MAFPANLEAMFTAGYDYLRWESCSECGEPVEIYSTPGKKEIAMEPMPSNYSPAVRHLQVCQRKENHGSSDVQDTERRDSDSGISGSHGNTFDATSFNLVPESISGGGALSVGGHNAQGSGIKLYGVNDPNHQLIAVGWEDGVLMCQWAKGKGYHTGIPEDKYLSLRRVPFAYSYYVKTIKGKFPYTKVG